MEATLPQEGSGCPESGDCRGGLANFLLFDLNDGLAVTRVVETARGRILDVVRAVLEPAVANGKAPEPATRDLSVSSSNLGDLHRGLGNGQKALEFYQKDRQIAEELKARNPQSADFARDVWVSYWRMATMAEQTGGGAQTWWGKAHHVLSGMKRRGIMLPADEQYSEQLRQKVRV